ncbi:N-acetylmuramoyl-L-alanine amidase [Gammaproteobacteria bacterium]
MRKLTVILDPAHGEDVAGKRSPDGLHREYKWSRDLINKFLAPKLVANGFYVVCTNTTQNEIGLMKRVHNADAIPGNNKILLSLHNNAAGMGDKWYTARGVCIYTSKGTTKSDDYATKIYYQLKKDFPELSFRSDVQDGDPDYEENFTILYTKCPAMLLEFLFQDNKDDVKLLQDEIITKRLSDSLVTILIKIDELL